MSDHVQQARDALDARGTLGPFIRAEALRSLLAHVETLIDPKDLEALGDALLGHNAIPENPPWRVVWWTPEGMNVYRADTAAEAIRAAREAGQ